MCSGNTNGIFMFVSFPWHAGRAFQSTLAGANHSGHGKVPGETSQRSEERSSNQNHPTDHQHHTQVHTVYGHYIVAPL